MPGENDQHNLRDHYTLAKFCAKRLHAHNVTAMSAALSFRTIFALIPLLVLAFLVARSVGVVDDGKLALRNFLQASGLYELTAVKDQDDPTMMLFEGPINPDAPKPAEPETLSVANYIESLVEDVEGKLTYERVGPIGAVLFIWTALTLLTTLEASLNRIFEAPKSRAMGRRIMIFWCAVTLGPILMIAATYVGRAAIETCQDLPGLSILANLLGWLAPILTGILVTAAGYRFIPNTGVRSSGAIIGAAIAVPTWMLARWAFFYYVESFVTQGNLYGVLGLVPLFLLWLNISWTIFLFGAEFAHTAGSLANVRRAINAEDIVIGPTDWLAVALAVARSFARGEGPVPLDRIAEQIDLPADRLEPIVRRLASADLITTTDDTQPKFALAKPPHLITVQQITDLADPNAAPTTNDSPIHTAITTAMSDTRTTTQSQTLTDLLNTIPEPDIEKTPATITQPTPATA